MNCVILQPSYIPWRGYFHQIQKADVFVFYDDVQLDKHGWRNRNRLKDLNGVYWLTIPILSKGTLSKNLEIKDIRIDSRRPWKRKHLASIVQTYCKAPFFKMYKAMLEEMYALETELLSDFTINTTIKLARELGIHHVEFVKSSELSVRGDKTGRIINIVKELGATHYISGPSAKEYLDEESFREAGITLEYMTYEYPEYEQLYPPFDPQLSVLDLIFLKGPDSQKYIWG